ncbi:MAG TPA: serine--tRNA ligase [Solirubrobacteraceae bacterium]
MLDLKRIRDDPRGVGEALARRDPALGAVVEEILLRDQQSRAATTSTESTRAMQKTRSEAYGAAKARGEEDPELLAKMQELSAQVKAFNEQASTAKQAVGELLARLPNLPDPSAAPGPEDELVRTVGEPPAFAFEPLDHLDLAGQRIDMERGARLSGSRFAYLKGDLVLLELALVRWTLEILGAHGFQPVIPPVLVREQALYGTGFLPDTEQQIYTLPDDDLYLVGTSEVALASLHADEILEADALPLRYAGFSPCFRREAGAAGKDTRGIFRVHQFDKVEMFSFVSPADSASEHERILAIEEQILTALGLAYRVVNIAVSELGNSAAKKYDCEAWLPSYGAYRELTSCSNTTDYQARRLNVRVRAERGTEPPHTLNGTAVAVGRTLVALLENGQQADGSVELPEVLTPYGAPARLDPA